MKKKSYTRDQFQHVFLQPVYDATSTPPLIPVCPVKIFFPLRRRALFVVIDGFTINGNFFFQRYMFHNGLVRRRFDFIIITTKCSLVQQRAQFGPASTHDIIIYLSQIDPDCWWPHTATRLSKNTESEHCPLFQPEFFLFFFSLSLDTMLDGISAFARAAHIDLVLVPCIGTSIDLEISF